MVFSLLIGLTLSGLAGPAWGGDRLEGGFRQSPRQGAAVGVLVVA
jgi:hypothetical protein